VQEPVVSLNLPLASYIVAVGWRLEVKE